VLARSDQGRLPLRREAVSADELLRRVRDRYAPDAAVASPPGLMLDADPVRLEQALGNLADNAERYGGGATRLAAVPDGDARVALHVEDHGAGVPAALRPHAFERFTRGDAARTDGGTGLGLAIVAAIAAAHGGDAGIDDRPDGGADVWISIPRPDRVTMPA
jgi:signal transduction histidine kinase